MVLICLSNLRGSIMLENKVPWNLKDVFSIHVLRLMVGLFLVRILYPMIFVATPFVIEVTDRLVVLALVCLVVRRHNGNFKALGLTFQNFNRNLFYGIVVGFILLGVSIFSERIYTTVLFLTPSQHPLVAQVEKAISWRDLASPLFLAGILAPLTEEILYRLFTFLPMKEKWGFWGGAIASSFVFALMHFNLYWLSEMILVGVGLSYLYYKTGSLISSIAAHSVLNTSKIIMLFLGISFV
ncbi:MAG: Abortive infection protein [Firmicutes bacterium]|nr:Abortive infection protein [Bacillota bacterium]